MRTAIKILLLLVLGVSCIQCTSKKAVTITPQQPERGQAVVITYDCSAPDAQITANAEEVSLKFSYSMLYELPTILPMQKKGSKWEVSFTLPRYATYASFYFEGGDSIDKPANGHYELMVYKDGKPVENAYLHKGYSLGAQLGKVDSLEVLQAKLYEKELEVHPHSYYGNLQLLSYQIKHSEGAEREAYRKQAIAAINANFHRDPLSMGNLNLTTAGFLIIGERDRLDSIKKVAQFDYPDSDMAKSMIPSVAAKEPDVQKRIALLEAAVANKKEGEGRVYSGAHRALLKEYIALKDEGKAVHHANILTSEENPYTPQTRANIAEELIKENIGLSAAQALLQQALDSVNSYPVGIIRYFPEFGYIPSYIEESERVKAIAVAKGNILSLMATAYAKQGKVEEAKRNASLASSASNDEKTLDNLSQLYTLVGAYSDAIEVYKKILVSTPTNSKALEGLKQSYAKQHGSTKGIDSIFAEVNAEWKKNMTEILNGERLNIAAPSLSGIVDLAGNPINEDLFKNKVVFVSFWATWCSPCMQKMPYVQRVYNKYKNNPRVAFLVVNSGARNTIEDARAWSKKSDYTFPIYYAQAKDIAERFDFNIIPASFMIDTKEMLQFKAIGFDGKPTIESKIELEIELLLSEAEAGM